MKRKGGLLAALAVLTVVLAGLRFWLVPPPEPPAELPVVDGRGAALWRGEQPLVGRIAGHDRALPPEAARCINCHTGATTSPDATQAAPLLTAHHLREAVPRRGGPPSRFDEAGFCTLLRTGLDPAAVLLPRHMPRYEIGDADCAALWRHLVSASR